MMTTEGIPSTPESLVLNTTPQKSAWSVLSKIDVNKKVEKKNGLTYLSWAWAWGVVKEYFPDANYDVIWYDNKPYLYDENLGYLVTTAVTINGETIVMNLPVMDGANKAMKSSDYTYKVKEYKNYKWTGNYVDKEVIAATMFDINTAIMRCLTKNLAMFGLGHYIYAGEDLPQEYSETDSTEEKKEVKTPVVKQSPVKAPAPKKEMPMPTPASEPMPVTTKTGTGISDEQLDLIRDFRQEFKKMSDVDDHQFLVAVSTQTKNIKELKDIPNITKLEASKVINYLTSLSAFELTEGREIENEKIKELATKYNLSHKK